MIMIGFMVVMKIYKKRLSFDYNNRLGFLI